MDASEKAENYKDEIRRLKEQLEEYKDLIDAIRNGGVDALAIYKNGKPDIYTLETTDFVYRVLVENFGESALNLNETGMIVYANSAFENLVGIPGRSIIGAQLESFVDEKDKDTFRRLFKSAFSGQSRGEIVLSHRDKKNPVHASLSSLYPRYAGIGVIFTDLSEKKLHEEVTNQLEQKIIDSSFFLKQILDSTLELITTFDSNLNYLSVNRIALEYMRVRPEDIAGKNVLEVYPELKDSSYHRSLQRALSGESIHERLVQDNSRGHVYFDAYFKPLMVNNGIAGVMVMARDITQNVQAKQKLEEINMAMDRKIMQIQLFDTEFFAINQLAIKEIEQEVMKLPALLEIIRNSGKITPLMISANTDQMQQTIAGICTQLVSLRKLNTALDVEGARIPVNLNKLLDEVKRNIADLIRENDAVLDSGNLPPVHVNPIQMHLVFSKIISNAIRMRRKNERPYIRILADLGHYSPAESLSPEKYWRISFADNGRGFERTDGDEIIYPEDGNGSKSPETELTVCRRIIQNHNGFMTAQNIPGAGGMIVIHLPYYQS